MMTFSPARDTPPLDLTGLGAESMVDLPQGRVRIYQRGDGPTIVFIHGMSVNAAAWRAVVPSLAPDFRCVTADWPFGAHRTAMAPEADLSAAGIAEIVAGTIAELGLTDVTLVGNDGGGLLAQIVLTRHPERIGRVVLTNCDAYENFPPPQYRYLCRLAGLPGSSRLTAVMVRNRTLGMRFARSRWGFGLLHRRPVDPAVLEHYLRGIREVPGVAADFVTFLRSVDVSYSMAAAERFAAVRQPVLVAWAREDEVFPPEYAHRLTADLPNATLEFIDDSATWISEDQPARLAGLIRAFVDSTTR